MTVYASFRQMLFLVLPFYLLSCSGQTGSPSTQKPTAAGDKKVGGAFENADFIDIGKPGNISATDTSAGWAQNGQKLLITGTIYQLNGKTPAPGVLLYYYHTNTAGRYIHKPGEKQSMPPNGLGQTHGYIRGWVKSDENGRYAIYTVKPGAYPTRDEPAHIHLTIQEPGIQNNYYLDDLVFDDDELLTTAKRKKMENRGGSGILRLLQKGGLQIAEHNIILGLHIPHYPRINTSTIQSGLDIGEDQPSFTPYHAYGPDKGSRACPVCKYGRYHGIIYFVGNHPDWTGIKKWLVFLEQQSIARSKYLKVYFVYGNDQDYTKATRQAELEQMGTGLKLNNTALTFVPSFADTESGAIFNKVNPDAENTFVIYRNSTIIEKFIDLKPTEKNFRLLSKELDTKKGDYFDLNHATLH